MAWEPGMDEVKAVVRERYALAARNAADAAAGCCSGSASRCCDPVSANLYDAQEAAQVPDLALRASLGCGNPTALARLAPGETVLDLGAGAGIDVLLAAQRVGPTGRAIGLDMTDAMLALAEENRRRAGLANVVFLKGDLEAIPLPDASVDVIVSNCVVNLAPDKDRALREAFRVLRPGGRFAVADIVLRGALPEALRTSLAAWSACVGGALHVDDYAAKLAAAGFRDVAIEPTRVYEAEDAEGFGAACGLDAAQARAAAGCVMSAFVRAVKPGGPRAEA